MIHHLTIAREQGELLRLSNNDGNDGCAHDGIRAVELTVEQHYGIHVYDDAHGRTWIALREGGGWSAPIPVQDLVRAHLGGGSAQLTPAKRYKLLGAGGQPEESATPGTLGGNSKP